MSVIELRDEDCRSQSRDSVSEKKNVGIASSIRPLNASLIQDTAKSASITQD